MNAAGRSIRLRGLVQGVGLRPWVWRLARDGRIQGRVWNDARGVAIEAYGAPEDLDGFLSRIEDSAPPAARISEVSWREIPARDIEGFRILASAVGEGREISLPADLPTCPDCLAELADPGDRRHRYPFINCTQCGPRFTIAEDVPYDRATTTMRRFPMCAACRAEYEDPADRRFHAEPIACWSCGPRLALVDGRGRPIPAGDPIAAAAAALAAGEIVAIQGLGGFHLACDARSPEAVSRLRRRKRREAKPLAVMVADLAAARREADLDRGSAELLASPERPIVLAPRAARGALADAVAPGLPQVGLLLPYTPIHHLLLAATGPLVMTSGNLAEEPIARTHAEAIARLGGIADRLLLHDREIAAACDDSVARTVAGRPMVLRRSRGFVPRPVVLAPPVARTVLACGAQWKNTFCLAHGDRAVFGAHVGDLDRLETFEVYEAGIARLERFLDLRPEIVAHDLHAGYLSTAYARRRPEPAIAVQHHHAHVVAVAAEHGLAGPVLGLAYDGTGAGPDGTAWGGELLWAERDRYRRLATLHPVALAGGDLAIREVWRLALAALDDAFAGAPPLDRLELFRRVPPRRLAGVRRMLANDLHAPRAHGLGRWFDLVGALLLGRLESRYEGEVALALDLAADPGERDAYPLELDFAAAPWRLDLRPALVAIVDDLVAGVAVGRIAGRFHSTVAVGSAALVQAAQAECGDLPVMLAGGCFQNAHLAAATISALGPDARVFLPRDVPPGDGGIALGQAVIADAVAALGKESAPCV